jgi:hypothetical protein
MSLKTASTYELIRELQSRGNFTELIVGIEDVRAVLKDFNSEESVKISLSDEEIKQIIQALTKKVSHFIGDINNEIYTLIYDMGKKSQKNFAN